MGQRAGGVIYATKENLLKETGLTQEELFSSLSSDFKFQAGDVIKTSNDEKMVVSHSEEGLLTKNKGDTAQSFTDINDIHVVERDGVIIAKANMAEYYLRGEVETYDQYLRGNVYDFSWTEYDVNGVEVESDSCGGFIGSNIHENGILEHLPKELEEEIKKGSKWAHDYDSGTTIKVESDQFQITDEIKSQAIDRLVQDDIKSILQSSQINDFAFLSAALKGEGFTPYSKLDIQSLQEEYSERLGRTIEEDFSATSASINSIKIDETMDFEKESAELESKVNSSQAQVLQ